MALARLGDNSVYDLELNDDHVVTPTFRNVHVDQSAAVYFGDQNIFQGPVTLEKIVLTNGEPTATQPSAPEHGYRTDGSCAADKKDSTEESPPKATNTPPPSRCRNILGLLKTKSKEKPLITIAIAIAAVLCLIAAATIIATGAGRGLTLLDRSQWGASPPTDATTPLVTPVAYVIIHHTATVNCSNIEECIQHVKFIQAFHVESRKFYDIGYNFLVGGDGTAFEGRGWTVEGAHSYGNNYRSIGIALIGTFNDVKPPAVQMSACRQLIARGVKLGFILEDYKLLAARQLATTESPGAALYAEMKTWPHWALEL